MGVDNPYPDSGFADQVEVVGIAMVLVWPGVLATLHPRVEVRSRGLLVVNWFTESRVPWAAIEAVVVEDRLALLLRDGRRMNVAAGAASLAGSVTGFRLQARMKRLIEDGRRPGSRDDVRVRTRLDVWPIPFVVTSAVLLAVGWLVVK